MRKATIIAALALALAVPTAAQAYTTGGEGSEAEVLTGVGPTWANPVNATAGHPEQYAESAFVQGETTRQLEVKNFHLAIPASATIKGIRVGFNAKVRFAPFSVFFTARLVKGAVTFAKHTRMDQPAEYPVPEWFGSSTDTWGTHLTPAEVNDATFGVSVDAFNQNGYNNIIYAGQVNIQVTYTLPTFYVNGVRLPEGGPSLATPALTWGMLTFSGNHGTWTCETEGAMRVYNTNGGGGAALVRSFAAHDCEAPTCQVETSEPTPLVAPYGAIAESDGSWEAKLIVQNGVTRLQIGNLLKPEQTATDIKLSVGCKGKGSLAEYGELLPAWENGTAMGSAPSSLNFDGPSGRLLNGGAYEDAATGKWRVMGYEGGELVTVK